MIKLAKEQILFLHTPLIEITGGSDGIRDIGLLESALESPFQSYGGVELYPSIHLGEEFYLPNAKWLSPKFEKSEIGNLRKQNEISPK